MTCKAILSEQRMKCREAYLMDQAHFDRIAADAVKAFNETVCQWLEGSGERHYEFVIRMQNEEAAE